MMEKQKFFSIFFVLVICLSISSISGFNFDNKKTFEKGDLEYGKVTIENAFGVGDKISELILIENTDVCDNDCYAKIEINLFKETSLTDDIQFKYGDIKNYDFYLIENGNKKKYNLNQKLSKGKYTLLIEGSKSGLSSVDWIIKSNGKWIDEWALWSANITLNSPPNSSVHNENITFNCSAVTNATLQNISLWTNSTGSWQLNETKSATFDAVFNKTFSQGNYLWNCEACDDENCSFSSNNYTFEVDTTNPQINLTSPTGVYDILTLDQTLDLNWTIDEGNIQLPELETPPQSYCSFGAYRGMYIDDDEEYLYTTGGTTITQFFFNNCSATGKTGTVSNSDTRGITRKDDKFYVVGIGGSINRVYEHYVSNLSSTGNSWDVSSFGIANGGIDYYNNNFYIGYASAKVHKFFSNLTSTGINYTLPYASQGIKYQNGVWWAIHAGFNRIDSYYENWSSTGNSYSTSPSTNELTITTTDNKLYMTSVSPANLYEYNMTKACWYDYNNQNISVGCSNNYAPLLTTSQTNLTFYANDTAGNLGSNTTSWDYKIFLYNETYSTSAYETSLQNFSINLLSNGSETLTANLFYLGVDYGTATKTGDDTNVTFTKQIATPVNGATANFYWNISYGDEYLITPSHNQTIQSIQFGICNATLTTPFLNFSFLNEENLSSVSAKADSTDFIYNIQGGSFNKTYLYNNISENLNYAFCFEPSDATIENDYVFQYSGSSYPQRRFSEKITLTNITTNKTLYLLKDTDGIYTLLQTFDGLGDQLFGVTVTAERKFNGIWTLLSKDVTDSAGSVTFWLNPNFDHRFTFTKENCTTLVVNTRPSQQQYTATMECQGEQEIFVSNVEGLKFARTPSDGIISSGINNFTFHLISSKDNIVKAKFQIVNSSDGSILNYTESSCTPSGCVLYLLHNVTSNSDLKGRYYIDIGEGYILIEADARWKEITIEYSEGTFRQFWLDLREIFNEWHDEGEDVTNTADYSRIVFFFLMMSMILALANKTINYDERYPKSTMIIVALLIIMGSASAGITSCAESCKGFFYYNNLSGSGSTFKEIINNYILALLMIFYTIGIYIKHRFEIR
jgi:hypothetical protein